MDIQWYPGHMTKTKRMIQENIKMVDVVIELVDARIPLSSKNPDIDTFAKGKHRIIILNKTDLANKNITNEWKEYFEQQGFSVVLANSVKGDGINNVYTVARGLMSEKIERLKQRGRIFVPIRSMIVGIPNVGKSTLINKYVGKKITETGDRPGVTKSKQWVKLKKDFELLDTPGILWPKFTDQQVGIKLAITGAINDKILDIETLSIELIKILMNLDKSILEQRYKIEIVEEDTPYIILEKIARKRGFIAKGNELDLERCSIILIDEFRASKLGNISLERPIDFSKEESINE